MFQVKVDNTRRIPQKKSPDLYLLHHNPDIIQKNIRLQLDFFTAIPITNADLTVLCAAANHQSEQNCHLQHLRECKRRGEISNTLKKVQLERH